MNHDFTAWVLRASMVGFTAGCKMLQQEAPRFGDLIKVRGEALSLFGLIYDVLIRDDPVMRQLILAEVIEPEVILDQRENRLVPIELNVLTVGYGWKDQIVQGFPPQPPVNLDLLSICDEADVYTFTRDLTYLRLILNTPQIPADELLVVSLNRAAAARPVEERYDFLLKAGRELARLLSSDLLRLQGLLARIKPDPSIRSGSAAGFHSKPPHGSP